jgi:hypothetical protein
MKIISRKMQLLLCFLAHYNYKVVKSCGQHNQIKYMAIGLTIPFIMSLAFLGGMDIVAQITDNWLAILLGGIVWAGIIGTFDWLLIVFSKSKSKVLLGLRVLVSLCIALIVSPPVPLMLSHDKVEAALQKDKQVATDNENALYDSRINEIELPIAERFDTLQKRQQVFINEALTGKGPLFRIKYENFQRDSASFEVKRKEADSAVASLNKQRVASINTIQSVKFGDYVTKVEKLFTLAVKEPYIGLVFFSMLIVLIIMEASALIFKYTTNNDLSDEYNVKISLLNGQQNLNAGKHIEKLAGNIEEINELTGEAEQQLKKIVINQQFIDLLKTEVKQVYAVEKLIEDLLKGLNAKDAEEYKITKSIIDKYRQYLAGQNVKNSGDKPFESVTFSKN